MKTIKEIDYIIYLNGKIECYVDEYFDTSDELLLPIYYEHCLLNDTLIEQIIYI